MNFFTQDVIIQQLKIQQKIAIPIATAAATQHVRFLLNERIPFFN